MKKILLLALLAACLHTTAQNIAINNDGSAPDPKAQLDIKSTNKGVLLPRITSLSAITGNVPLGLIVFVTDGDRGFYYNASALPGIPNWKKLATGEDSYWQYNSPNYLYWSGTANVGIGTTTPGYKLVVRSNNQGITQENADGSMQIGFYTNSTTGALLQTHTNHPLKFSTNNGLPQVTLLTNGNLGVGTEAPAYRLTAKGDGIGIAQESVNGAVKLGLYVNSGAAFLETITNHPLNFTTNDGSAQMQLSTAGTLGIGTSTPTEAGLVVDKKIGAVNGLFGSNTTGVALESNWPGVGFNSYYNGTRKAINAGFGGLMGLNPNNGDFYIQSATATTATGADMTTALRLLIDKDGDVGLEGNTTPHVPLSFANFFGSKISLYGSSETVNYGLGMGTGTMQLYTPSGADIAFGTGGSSSFSENVRIKGSGNVGLGINNPSERLEIFKGRIRFRGNINASNTHGITWTNGAGTADRAFIGQYDDNTFGFYGFTGAGWNFLWDVNDGSLRLGTTQKASGYMLNVGGKAIAEEVRVQLRASWPDYVFKKGYTLMPLSELENFIANNNHLPNIPKAEVLEKEGTDLGEMQRKMMEKIEELTLYVIELKKEVEQQKTELSKLKSNQSTVSQTK